MAEPLLPVPPSKVEDLPQWAKDYFREMQQYIRQLERRLAALENPNG